jgi:hypothetical protein
LLSFLTILSFKSFLIS